MLPSTSVHNWPDIQLRRRIDRWCRIWGVPDLAKGVIVVRSKRLRITLARCHPMRRTIVLRDDLSIGDRDRLAEVLCHEFAHIAAYELYGSRAKAHGHEWQELVRLAGLKPQIRMKDPHTPKTITNRRRSALVYEHRCPVCQMMRMARRPVANWRCSECVIAGLGGALIITSVESIDRQPRAR